MNGLSGYSYIWTSSAGVWRVILQGFIYDWNSVNMMFRFRCGGIDSCLYSLNVIS